ncbi:tetratricopeptide repeat protein [Bacillus solitudinis]|uniref:tetratricopeptide repeat protein n=1 Tax=Bacillus solitudinis TaxID=2014074 RepID=UPI000C24ADE3|nr:tetratricopeptide repeat protein [Bacillus solitudinis]
MSDKHKRKKDSNIVLYPGLVKRLIEKGMDALKKKEARTAYDYFVSAEQHEPDNPQVRFGIVLSLVELGRLEEAVKLTSSLLKEGIGDYYDNLQVHISLLVQLGYYQEVVDILDAVLAENRIPSQFAESFYQLLHFSRQMIDDNELIETIESQGDDFTHGSAQLLENNSLQKQWQGIQELKTSTHPVAIESLITYIENVNHDLFLRSMALQVLHKHNIERPVTVEKLGQKDIFVPAALEELYEMQFGQSVVNMLEQQLEHENPILLEMAKQLCWAHLYIVYPFLPIPSEVPLWGAVFHLVASERLGLEETEEDIATIYGCSLKLLMEKGNEVIELESKVFRGI